MGGVDVDEGARGAGQGDGRGKGIDRAGAGGARGEHHGEREPALGARPGERLGQRGQEQAVARVGGQPHHLAVAEAEVARGVEDARVRGLRREQANARVPGGGQGGGQAVLQHRSAQPGEGVVAQEQERLQVGLGASGGGRAVGAGAAGEAQAGQPAEHLALDEGARARRGPADRILRQGAH